MIVTVMEPRMVMERVVRCRDGRVRFRRVAMPKAKKTDVEGTMVVPMPMIDVNKFSREMERSWRPPFYTHMRV